MRMVGPMSKRKPCALAARPCRRASRSFRRRRPGCPRAANVQAAPRPARPLPTDANLHDFSFMMLERRRVAAATIVADPRQRSRRAAPWLSVTTPRNMASCARAGLLIMPHLPDPATARVLAAVISSRPSRPRVTPKPLARRPPKATRGSAVGTIRSLTMTVPTRSAAPSVSRFGFLRRRLRP